jgi:hypothetical protein
MKRHPKGITKWIKKKKRQVKVMQAKPLKDRQLALFEVLS